MSYQQLTEGRRYKISPLLELKISISEIAQKLKYYLATVYRELKRNQARANITQEDSRVF